MLSKKLKTILRILGLLLITSGIVLIILGVRVFRTFPFGDVNWPWGDEANVGFIVPGAFMIFIGIAAFANSFLPARKTLQDRVEESSKTLENKLSNLFNQASQAPAKPAADERAAGAVKPQNNNCPNCGAKMGYDGKNFTCEYCGTVKR